MKTYRFVYILVIAALALSACGVPGSTEEHQPLKVGWNLWPGSYPLVIAQEKGFFEKHGVKVELSLYPTYSQTFTEFDLAKVDSVSLVVGDALLLNKDGKAKVVVITDSSDGGDSIIASADVKSVADLRGKRIGVQLGTFGEMLVREMLKRNNLSTSDVLLVDTSPEDLPAQLGRTVDAGHTFEPFTTQASQRGYHVIFSSAETPGLIPDVIIFRSSVTSERPQDVRAFVAAFFEAQDWWLANQDEASVIIAEATGQKPEDISIEGLKLFTSADNSAAFTPGENTTSLFFTTQLYADFQIQSGRLSLAPDLKQLIDASFLP